MKKISAIALLLTAAVVYGQKISDYQYVYVPGSFESAMGKYNLRKLLIDGLQAKKYVVLSEDTVDYPVAVQQNSCNMVRTNLVDDSSFLRNKVKLEFTGCNGKTLATLDGKSMIKDYEPGFQDALKKALDQVPVSDPKEQAIAMAQKSAFPASPQQSLPTAQPSAQPVSTVATASTGNSGASVAEIYKSGNLQVQKINMGTASFILVSQNSSSPYATFSATGKSGVYKVKLADGTLGFGYFDNGNLVIEILNPNGADRAITFQRQ